MRKSKQGDGGRDDRGRFAKGCRGGPGRPRKGSLAEGLVGSDELWAIVRESSDSVGLVHLAIELRDREILLASIRSGFVPEVVEEVETRLRLGRSAAALLLERIERARALLWVPGDRVRDCGECPFRAAVVGSCGKTEKTEENG